MRGLPESSIRIFAYRVMSAAVFSDICVDRKTYASKITMNYLTFATV